jgi:hypothetical protein
LRAHETHNGAIYYPRPPVAVNQFRADQGICLSESRLDDMRLPHLKWTFVLATAIVLAACQSYRAELEEAQRLRQAGEPEKARRMALDIIEQKPRQTAAWLSLVKTDVALAEKARRKGQPDSATLYLWEAARAVISHRTGSRLTQSHWKEAATSASAGLARDLSRYMQRMVQEAKLVASPLIIADPSKAERLVRRVLFYRELLRRLPEPSPGDFATLENRVDDLTKLYIEALKLDPMLRDRVVEELDTLLNQDLERLLVARKKLGGIPLEIFLDMPLELYLK